MHIQFSSVAQFCWTLCDPMVCSMPGFPVHHQLLELTQTHVIKLVMPANHLILCHPLLLLPSIFPSIRVFSSESVLCIGWAKYMDCIVHGILQARILEWVAFPGSRDLPNPGIEPRSPALQVDSLSAEPQGKPICVFFVIKKKKKKKKNKIKIENKEKRRGESQRKKQNEKRGKKNSPEFKGHVS